MDTSIKDKNLSSRFNRWQTKQIDLLTFTINLLFVISIALYGFFLNPRESSCINHFCEYYTHHLLAFFLPFNMTIGLVALVIRLNDFKITKNLIKTRKSLKKSKALLSQNTSIIGNIKSLENKIKLQKSVTKWLGKVTWILFYIQVIIFLFIIWSII
jgi:hypothetical protein